MDVIKESFGNCLSHLLVMAPPSYMYSAILSSFHAAHTVVVAYIIIV